MNRLQKPWRATLVSAGGFAIGTTAGATDCGVSSLAASFRDGGISLASSVRSAERVSGAGDIVLESVWPKTVKAAKKGTPRNSNFKLGEFIDEEGAKNHAHS